MDRADDRSAPSARYRRPYAVAESLDLRCGPSSGTVQLPTHLDWSGCDLAAPGRIIDLYRAVLMQAATPQDLCAYLSAGTRRRLWAMLWLPNQLRRAWERKFPSLLRSPRTGQAVVMTQDEFISVVQRGAFEDAAGESAIKPIGRKPHQLLVTLWDWYTALPEGDKTLVRQAMRISAYGALFGVFAMIDGVRQVDDPPHGELRLAYVGADGTEQALSGQDPDLDELHSLWAAAAFPYTKPQSA